MSSTWIVYKADDSSAEGWEQRLLMPSSGLTDILEENWDSSDRLPQIGDRTRDYANLADPGNGATHGKDGDWVVTRVQQFVDAESSDRVVVCHCTYQPITAQWAELRRGSTANELLAVGSRTK